MSNEQTPMEGLTRRLASVEASDTDEDILDKTGMDVIDEAPSLISLVEHTTLVNPRADESTEAFAFDSSFTEPNEFPTGWPFISDHECFFGIVRAGAHEIRTMIWPEPADSEALVNILRVKCKELDWREYAADDAAVIDGGIVVWLNQGEIWRSLKTHSEPLRAVSLNEDSSWSAESS